MAPPGLRNSDGRGIRVDLEPLDVSQVARLRELHLQPGVTKWWGPMEHGFPFDEPESQRFAIVARGEIVGMIQWGDSSSQETRQAYVDIFLGDDFAGRGIGTEALRALTAMLIEQHGYQRITLDPAAENEAAIHSYEKAGFRRIGVQRRASRDHESGHWRDELMMELVVGVSDS
jgi:aminoglycoside 6'-N-acetyltransferase